MISFLVTYYNQQNYVSRSLESILNQKLMTDFEILVGDDGSNDDTVKIVEEYKKKNSDKIKIFIQPREKGKKYLPVIRASQNRLNLISNARGQYICFLDGDDAYCDYNFIQNSINEMEKNPKISGVAHNYVVVYNNVEKKYNHKIIEKKFITMHDYAKNLYIHVGAIIFRNQNKKDLKTVFNLNSFDDNNITYYFLNYGPFLYIDNDVYNYYSNDNSICTSSDDLEMKILNALDYQINKKIIKKEHFSLFLRYFDTRYFIYKNRKKIEENKYQKWIDFSIINSLDYKIINWKNQKLISKVIVIIYFNLLKIFVKIFYYIRSHINGYSLKLRKVSKF